MAGHRSLSVNSVFTIQFFLYYQSSHIAISLIMSQTGNITVSSLITTNTAFTTSPRPTRITTAELHDTTEFEGSDAAVTIVYCVIVGVTLITMCCCMVSITRVYTTRQNPQIVFRTNSKFSVRMPKSSSRNQIYHIYLTI